MTNVTQLPVCTCLEVHGEDPDCVVHGEATEWARDNVPGFEWQAKVLDLREQLSEARRQALEEAARAAWGAQIFPVDHATNDSGKWKLFHYGKDCAVAAIRALNQ